MKERRGPPPLGLAKSIYSGTPIHRYAKGAVKLYRFIIQQIVTTPIYGKEALNICHLYMTDILRYT